jgi:hypothetical protein
MDRRKVITAVLMGATLLVIGMVVMSRMSGGSEEDRIRAVLDAVAEAAEDRNAGGFVAHLTEDFVLKPDEMDRGRLRLMLAGTFLRLRKSPAVVFRNVEIDVQEDRAIATLQAAAAEAGAIAAGVRPDRAWDIRCHLRLEEGEWMIEKAEHSETNW